MSKVKKLYVRRKLPVSIDQRVARELALTWHQNVFNPISWYINLDSCKLLRAVHFLILFDFNNGSLIH